MKSCMYNSFVFTVNGGWTDWSEWLPCSTSCGGGDQNRYRYCSNPVPGLGGHICVGKSIEKKVCNTMTCPSKISVLVLCLLNFAFDVITLPCIIS